MLAQGGASSSSGDNVEIAKGCNKRESVAASNPGPRKRNHTGEGDAIVEAMLESAAAMPKSEDLFVIY